MKWTGNAKPDNSLDEIKKIRECLKSIIKPWD